MKTYKGSVDITKSNEAEWAAKLKGVTKITGDVRADNCLITAPLLAEVGGDVWADNGSITAPLLAEVGGDVWAYNASITAPLLAEVGGDVRAYNGSKLDLKKDYKKEIGPIVSQKVKAKIQKSFEKKKYLFCDNILTKIISKRKVGQVVFWKTKKIGSDKIVYVAQRGESYSHGETTKQASHDLRYKIAGNRDMSVYKKWTLETVKPLAEMIQAYRVITGACETGTKQWCEGKKLPPKLSVKVAIRATRGAYQAGKFAEFFKGEK